MSEEKLLAHPKGLTDLRRSILIKYMYQTCPLDCSRDPMKVPKQQWHSILESYVDMAGYHTAKSIHGSGVSKTKDEGKDGFCDGAKAFPVHGPTRQENAESPKMLRC